jgi:diguanylate cyclase (GGDEF)-like protein/hemerythrin-like metal-binding protein/PAS domain S-box-containing protein
MNSTTPAGASALDGCGAEEQLQNFFALNLDLFMIADLEGNILRANLAWQEFLGISEKELHSSKFQQFIHPDDIEATNKAVGKLPEQGVIFDFINRYRHRSGEYRHVEWRARIQGDLIYAAARDITGRLAAEKEAKYHNDLLELLFTQSLAGIFFMMLDEPVYWNDRTDKEKVLDYVFAHQRITQVNPAMLAQYRASSGQMIGATPNELFAHDPTQGRAVWKQFFDEGHLHIDTDEQRMDGSSMAVLGDYICLYDEKGRIIGHFGIQEDVTEARNSQKALERMVEETRVSERKYRLLAENMSDVVWTVDVDRNVFSYVSPSILQQTGYSVEELLGMPLSVFLSGDSLSQLESILKEARETLTSHPGTVVRKVAEIRPRRKNGKHLWVEASLTIRMNDSGNIEIQGTSRDITERKQAEALRLISYTDQLTGLYNRHFLNSIIDEEMERSDRYGHPVSIAMLDLDHFKNVNDTHGHLVGDEVLKGIASTILSTVRGADVVVRYGGEEFLILMPDTALEGARVTAEKIRMALENIRHPVAGTVTVSLGVGSRIHSESRDRWLRRVDEALYRAKDGGRNRTEVSDGEEQYPSASFHIEWSKAWESGDDIIDAQHLALNDVANLIMEGSLAGWPKDRMLTLLEGLLQDVRTHFAHEERVMEEVGYPDTELHAGIHKRLLAKALRLKRAYLNGTVKAMAFFSFIVDDVMLGHLQNVDTKYFPFTKRRRKELEARS